MRLWILLPVVAACGSPPAAKQPPGPALEASGPPATCELEYELEVSGTSVVAVVTNHATAQRFVTFPDRCPGQAVELLGLGDGFDADDRCGIQCEYDESPPPDTRAIPPGETVALASWTLHAEATRCNPALSGRYELSFDPSSYLTSATTCGPAAAAVVIEAAPPRPACPEMPACGIGCPGPMAHDDNGCTLCACEDVPRPGVAP